MKSRMINLIPVIFKLRINMYDGHEIKAQWSVQFIVPINVTYFNYFSNNSFKKWSSPFLIWKFNSSQTLIEFKTRMVSSIFLERGKERWIDYKRKCSSKPSPSSALTTSSLIPPPTTNLTLPSSAIRRRTRGSRAVTKRVSSLSPITFHLAPNSLMRRKDEYQRSWFSIDERGTWSLMQVY